MPFLRVIRDKRGYETTYLMHWYREGARQRSRILYVFRSPGGVRVGRESLEPDVLRDIETHHPDIVFDWKAVIENRQVVDTTPDLRRPRKRRRSDEEPAPAAEAMPSLPPPARPRQDPPSESRVAARPDEPALAGRSAVADPPGGAGPAPAAPPRPIPPAIEGSTPDEQMAFLAMWYPIVRDRIPQRTSDPARREALLALAGRLNPMAWTDADQIVAGLQQAAESLERLSRVFSRRRRRSKRPSAHSTGSPPGGRGLAPGGVERSGAEDVGGVEPPIVGAAEPLMVRTVEPLMASAVERPARADGPAQDDPSPVTAGGEQRRTAVTDTPPADE